MASIMQIKIDLICKNHIDLRHLRSKECSIYEKIKSTIRCWDPS